MVDPSTIAFIPTDKNFLKRLFWILFLRSFDREYRFFVQHHSYSSYEHLCHRYRPTIIYTVASGGKTKCHHVDFERFLKKKKKKALAFGLIYLSILINNLILSQIFCNRRQFYYLVPIPPWLQTTSAKFRLFILCETSESLRAQRWTVSAIYRIPVPLEADQDQIKIHYTAKWESNSLCKMVCHMNLCLYLWD